MGGPNAGRGVGVVELTGEDDAKGLWPKRLHLLEDVGHLFFWERPERSAALLRAHAAVHA